MSKKSKKKLVIVESPAKAKTLKKFLGSGYSIEACVGHVRDLPKSELGINIDDDFEPKYITIRGKGEVLAKLRKQAKTSDIVYLATDPDREGEAISWHLIAALKLDESKAARITFNEITKTAVKKAVSEARQIDMNLVDAQQARRELDRIVGYKLSPLLWKKVRKGLSAGRVQSVALKIICDREDEIESFTPVEYWSIEAKLTKDKISFVAKLHSYMGDKLEVSCKNDADKILHDLYGKSLAVDEVKTGVRSRKPAPPFSTSTLQQEAHKRLGFTTKRTMMVAQQLYEGVDIAGEGSVGLVTYIRTDSLRISDESYADLQSYITDGYGTQYLNPTRVEHKNRRGAQDAHEAIRPTSVIRTPFSVKESLSSEQYKLYKLIWERFVSSHMMPASYDTVSAKLSAEGYEFRASGSKLSFDGYLRVYNSNEDDTKDTKIPSLTAGDILPNPEIKAIQHFTQPPPRYSEAMLVKTLEELGIGRPSTYSATITTLGARRYLTKENKVFYPTELGEIVNDIIKNNFEDIVDIDFTAKMEEELDLVEDGKMFWKELLRKFYPPFQEKIEAAEETIGSVEIPDEVTDTTCESCGKNMVIKHGRFGKFLACPGFPDCRNTKPHFDEAGVSCPRCTGRVFIKLSKNGRKYYGCEHSPDCDFMSWNLPTGENCPSCDGFLVEKGRKSRRIACSNSECGYSKEVEDNE